MRQILTLLLCLILTFLVTIPADAVIRETHESSNQILYQSRQTWRDNSNNPWQVIFFKRIKGTDTPQINLRLVGFPELIEFAHPQPLTLKIRENLIIKVPDVFASEKEAFAPNVGQYDFTPIIDRLESNNFWWLELPLKNESSIRIKIPYFLLEEWQKIIAKSDINPETVN